MSHSYVGVGDKVARKHHPMPVLKEQIGEVTGSVVLDQEVKWEVTWPSGCIGTYSAYQLSVLEEISDVHFPPDVTE